MLKAWKEVCNVEMRSICLEIAAVVFTRAATRLSVHTAKEQLPAHEPLPAWEFC